MKFRAFTMACLIAAVALAAEEGSSGDDAIGIKDIGLDLPPNVLEEEQKLTKTISTKGLKARAVPATGCVRLKAFYNTWWLQHFQNNHTLAKEFIMDLIEEANKNYRKPGLSTIITLKTYEEPQFVPSPYADWEVGFDPDGEKWLRHHTITDTVNDDPERFVVHHYAFFTKSPFSDSILGIAWKGTVCLRTALSYKVSLSEFNVNLTETGGIFAHEVGHSLGMEHDFCDFQGCVNSATSRVSADGSNCTGVQGFMDYFPIRNIWTKCSDEDYQRYIERIGGSCLPEQCPAQKPVVPVDLGPNSPCFNACGGTACGDPMFCKNLKEADEGCQSPDASILCRKTCNKCSATCENMDPSCSSDRCINPILALGVCPKSCGFC